MGRREHSLGAGTTWKYRGRNNRLTGAGEAGPIFYRPKDQANEIRIRTVANKNFVTDRPDTNMKRKAEVALERLLSLGYVFNHTWTF